MPVPGAGRQISEAVRQWPGVVAASHRFGGVEFLLGRREIGHIHGDHLVDIPFPVAVRRELVAGGAAEPHHVLPDSGWISFYVRSGDDVAHAIGLLRRSYDLAVQQRQRRAVPEEANGHDD